VLVDGCGVAMITSSVQEMHSSGSMLHPYDCLSPEAHFPSQVFSKILPAWILFYPRFASLRAGLRRKEEFPFCAFRHG